MATIRHPLVVRRAAILALLVGATPALAQGTAGDPAGPTAKRSIAATGQTKPPAGQTKPPGAQAATAPLPKPVSAVEMAKAQKAAEARSKAWDIRTKRSMSSICKGC